MSPITAEQLEKWKRLAERATSGPWAIESCGEKGDGSNMIGVVFGPDDPDAERPLSGWISENDWADKLGEPMADPFYRDTEVAECAHRNGNHNSDAAFIAASRTAVPALVAEVERLREALYLIAGPAASYTYGQLVEIARAALPEEPADGA